jgi:hypothetical protein
MQQSAYYSHIGELWAVLRAHEIERNELRRREMQAFNMNDREMALYQDRIAGIERRLEDYLNNRRTAAGRSDSKP